MLVGPGTAMGYAEFTTAMLVSALGSVMWPHLFMKAYAAESEGTLKKTVVMYPTFFICMVPLLFIGFAGVLQVTPEALGQPDRILPWMFTQLEFSPLVVGLILAAALAAAMSTQDAITHAAGSIFTIDIVETLRKTKHSDAEATFWVRVFVVLFGLAAYLVAIFGGQSLVALLLGAYGSIVQLLPLILATFFWPRATTVGAIGGFAGGVLVNYGVVLDLVPGIPGVHAGLQALLVNLVLLVGLSLLTRPMDRAHLDRFNLHGAGELDQDQTIVFQASPDRA
jgi:SSS family solute:Na+ symporter